MTRAYLSVSLAPAKPAAAQIRPFRAYLSALRPARARDTEPMSSSPYATMDQATQTLLGQFNNGDYTSKDSEGVFARVQKIRMDLLSTRLGLPSTEEQERHEPERWRLLRTLLLIQQYLPFSESPYAGIQADAKALFVRAEDPEYREQNRDSILTLITSLRCDMLKHIHPLQGAPGKARARAQASVQLPGPNRANDARLRLRSERCTINAKPR